MLRNEAILNINHHKTQEKFSMKKAHFKQPQVVLHFMSLTLSKSRKLLLIFSSSNFTIWQNSDICENWNVYQKCNSSYFSEPARMYTFYNDTGVFLYDLKKTEKLVDSCRSWNWAKLYYYYTLLLEINDTT